MVVLSKIQRPNNTSMASIKLLSLFILASYLNFATSEEQHDPVYLSQYCLINETTANSIFQSDLRTLFSSLQSNATGSTEFYKTIVTGRNPSDSVYGLFMCRGDVPSHLCQQCVVSATQRLSSNCPLSKQAVIWYVECMVRYSNRSFFSTVDTSLKFVLWNTANISNQESSIVLQTINRIADEAANYPIGAKKFATKQAWVSGYQFLYSLAQCTQDLSPQDCRSCLSYVIENLTSCCEGSRGGRVLYPSCNIRYEYYPFYLSNSTTPAPTPTPTPAGLVPATKTSEADSKSSEDPGYLSHNCSSNETFTTYNTIKLYLRTLLSYLSSNATSGKKFSKADVDNTAYGLFMCRGDIPPRLCGQCVRNATDRISSECRLSAEAIIWYSHCLLRYSNRSFFSMVDRSPIFYELNVTSTSNPNQEQSFFTFTLSNILTKVAEKTADADEKYATESFKLNALQTLYTLAQCTLDLSSVDCKGCLSNVIGSVIPWSHLGSVGGRVLYPSCNVRFELFQFYRDGDEALAPGPGSPSPSGPTGKGKGWSRTIILIVVSTFLLAMMFSFGYYLLRRKARKSNKTILKENFGHESATLEPLQFNLAVIEAATNNFSHENKIGKGGFGEVYKGILFDGRQIAVKKLSKSSKQGANEFKNEVLLIAKLQHRNLVAFIGFCLEEQEKMLVYEYVPNKSLDYFLFDTQRHKLLSWFERHNIIGGIARGILYLHEYSRLKVIHRDLKPSNILLDENMIPKISDFGLARIVDINQDQGSTDRIVGTYGYMSPEYAMLGQFSEKSDVFSFGVMVLEIITGKKNISSFESHSDGLLNYVWRQWRNQTPLTTLDPNIKDNYSEIEVINFIQIGLLCVQQNLDVRPTMATVVSYLSSHSIKLPTPQEPGFLLHTEIDPKAVAEEPSSSKSINSSTLLSINEMPISEFLPR